MVCDWPWKMAVSYQGGYLATEKSGSITAALGRRVIAIDGRPAADVYEGWMGKRLPRGESILGHTTLTPLGLVYGVGSGLDVHVLVHPERINDDGSISCFTDVSPAERIMMMEASIPSLVRRGGLVARYAMQKASVDSGDVVAGFLIYCAGCLLALGDGVDDMVAGVTKALPGGP